MLWHSSRTPHLPIYIGGELGRPYLERLIAEYGERNAARLWRLAEIMTIKAITAITAITIRICFFQELDA
jgi:glycosyltransferase A (GT-A) superfamily protein (DUF2064 family)